ncbi:hypothetical protein CHS0354_042975 [Potamilus streckersoni]|uniref:Uncharacterized protein n=1 Tax=Potamilus streckersoni TaxID=2493646 RepID=A0AAE0T4J2_9BIVA|nr:hypothetical protein CHS0354_042975 [Potamilus streckersoni]
MEATASFRKGHISANCKGTEAKFVNICGHPEIYKAPPISQSCEALNDMGVNIGGLFTDSTRHVGVFGNTRAYQFFQTVELKDQFVSSMMGWYN